MFLVGTVSITKVVEKEWEGRKYYKCQALGSDKEVYSVSLSAEQNPRVGDIFQLKLEPSDRDWKPAVKLVREK